jgi:hypothetical protein
MIKMKSTTNLRRFIWLIDLISKAGDKGITFVEINNKWRAADYLSEGHEYPLRTFNNHRKDIESIFDIEIRCHLNDYTYYIENDDAISNVKGLKKWLLGTISVKNMIANNQSIKNRIILEETPSSHNVLSTIIEAMQDNKMLVFDYKPYWKEESSHIFDFEPWALKNFKKRWYVLGKFSIGQLRIFALDRMKTIDISVNGFEMPDTFDASSFFDTVYGIIIDEDIPVQDITLKVEAYQSHYMRALPLHPSQNEEERCDGYSIFSLHLRPTFDFIQELLSLGEKLEVLAPKSLRSEIARIGKEIAKKNK